MKNKSPLILFLIVLLFRCSNEKDLSPTLIGSQLLSCDHFINLDKVKVNNLETPTNFKITPKTALRIVKQKTSFKCHHKIGAQIYADDKYYYFVRMGFRNTLNLNDAITTIRVIVSGIDGSYWELKSGGSGL